MKKPNLLFLFADQWRRDAIGASGNNEIITPNMDEFVRESLYMENAYSTSPLCSPNRASILSGCFPRKTGVWTNCKEGLDVKLDENLETIGDVLKKSGYSTGYIGKWHLDEPDTNNNLSDKTGARDWDAYTPPGEKRHGFDFWYSYGAYDNHLKPHYWSSDEKMIEIDKWSVEHETDIAIDFLEENKEKEFALFVSWNPPHTPLDLVPEKYIKMYENKKFTVQKNVKLKDVTDHTESVIPKLNFSDEKYQETVKKYYSAVTGVDENFGRVINKLKELRVYDETIVVLTADHGEMLCSHGLWSKHVWFEESVGIPFIIRWGKKLFCGKSKSILNSVDMMPTLLSLMQLPIPSSVQGMDLKEVLITGLENDNEAIMTCYPGQIQAINKFKRAEKNNLDFGWRAIRDKKYTYVINRGYSPEKITERWLYDNENDPLQINPQKIEKIENSERAKYFEDKLRIWEEKNG